MTKNSRKDLLSRFWSCSGLTTIISIKYSTDMKNFENYDNKET